ncbi:permease [Microbaculum marinisediminis]|uniref:Permease n=1 Tax=Microbaculum marinisediminis TaxID=2931392 RepID=A0AAW5QUZ9_9HYPH|nr:permease [Microbaculum sp. A6E488]MCT8970381.1 permease [Microbaculum sp. A6E488]
MTTAIALLRRRAATIDPAVAAILIVLAVLAAAAPAQARASAIFTVDSLISILPYLAASIGLAAYAAASGADNLIARAFRGHTAGMVVMAALIGALSPFCSCGVIPLIAALLAMGVPLAPVMAFWLASPIMDPSMFALTAGTLGMEFAIAKTIAAIGMGLLGGFGMWALMKLPLFESPLRPGIGDGGCGGSKVRAPKPVVWAFWDDADRRETFTKNGLRNTVFLGKWLTLAFLLESLMLAYIPAEMIAHVLGSGGVGTVALATVVGIPAYLNGYAALPLVGGLIDQGMAPGVGMAFLVAGGVTSIPAAIAVFALARPPVFAAYVGFALSGALIAGLVYGAVA